MANIWDEFDKAFDTEALAKDVEEAAENGGRRDVPHDTYEISVQKLELTKSKKGDPMVTCWMKIVEGEYKGSLIFMNQVVTQGFQIHIVNEFVRSLISEMADPIDVHFKTYAPLITGKTAKVTTSSRSRKFTFWKIKQREAVAGIAPRPVYPF